MNNLPIAAILPNISHVQRSDNGAAVNADAHVLSADDFSFSVVPFATLHHGWVKRSKAKSPSFGFTFADNPLLHRPYVSMIKKGSAAALICSTYCTTNNKL